MLFQLSHRRDLLLFVLFVQGIDVYFGEELWGRVGAYYYA